MKINEKTLDISLLLGAFISIMAAMICGFTSKCEEMEDSAFRLHILANSDDSGDLALKNDVRDYIIEELGFIFDSADTKEEAVKLAERNKTLISERVNGYLSKRGVDYKAICTVEKSRFATRKYGSYTLPAGEYDSLKIVLGEGKGHNWWCVLFPTVCIPAASDRPSPFPEREAYKSEKMRAALTVDGIMSDRRENIEYKFLAYEWLREVFGF